MSYIEFLQSAIKTAHGCDSVHVKTAFVSVEVRGIKWEGEVDVFELKDHPTEVRCFTWCDGEEWPGGPPTVHVRLAEPPAITPEAAIRSYLESNSSNQTPRVPND